jgi:phenylalanyl-tRNA synthetase beta chain
MKISYNWLKQFLKIDWEAEKIAELLTDLGLEVEGIEVYQSVKGGLAGVVIGKIVTCEKHPNADRLKLTTVDVGSGKRLKIVCGAPNVAKGQTVPVATIGTTLYNQEGEPWTIKKGKIRGEESHGMICAEDELGLGSSHEGIMILDDSIEAGTLASSVFEVENDIVFEIGLTPNRSDAMSHYGVARDLRAGLIQKEKVLELITPSVSAFHVDSRLLKIDVEVQDKHKAPRYCGLTISGLKVEESPKWLQNRLRAIGLKPINNIVDITNYVLHELGQPLHAFDAARIKGSKIIVKTLPTGTKFTTLDGIERELHQEDLMICDAEKPMCIAGVYGGLHSGVTESTTSIFLESAYFSPIAIRKTSKRHGLNTDASFRFERSIDPNITAYALKRAALLITKIAGGEITSDIVDEYPEKIKDFHVRLSFENVKNLIGEKLPEETIKRILTSLEIKVNNFTEAGLGLTVPAYRSDVQREADIIEEILRVYGYNNIATTDKLNASISNSSKFEDYKIQNIVAEQLVSQGFYEIMTNSLTTPEYGVSTNESDTNNNVELLNPLSQDLSVMRRNLLFSGLEAIAHNINRKQADLKLFEFGKSYHNFSNKRVENKHLALFVTGNKSKESWAVQKATSDFYYLKGLVYAVLERLGISQLTQKASQQEYYQEGWSLSHAKVELVSFGSLKKSILKQLDIGQTVWYADFKWDAILQAVSHTSIQFKAIPKYPQVRRDLALLIDNHISFDSILTIAEQTEKKLLKEVSLFDVYKGSNLPAGKKSYAVSFILQDENKTLTDKQIDKIMSKLQNNFSKQLGAELR